MAALKHQSWAIERLTPYAGNARTHSEAQVEQIVASIREFGWTNPILVDAEGEVIAGHGRLMAAQRLGFKRVPVIILGHLTPEQKRAYVIADNKLALNAGWDEKMLAAELQALAEGGYDIGVIGFSDDELQGIIDAALPGAGGESAPRVSLAEQFGVPPFSVMNARIGWWQDRKRAWLALGIQSELGRGEAANDRGMSGSARINDAADGQKRYKRKANAAPGGSPLSAGMEDYRAGRGSYAKGRKPDAIQGKAARKRASAAPGGAPLGKIGKGGLANQVSNRHGTT